MNAARAASQGARTLVPSLLAPPVPVGGRTRVRGAAHPSRRLAASPHSWPFRLSPFRRSLVRLSPFRLAGVIVLALALAGCGTTTPSASPSAASASPPAPSGASASPSTEPTADPNATPEPTESPSAAASPSPETGSAGCTGSAGNQDFFSAIAQAVGWPVYCAVLPDGWFIGSGNYRLRDQGQMRVAYRGPGGGHFELREGAFCTDAGGCVPNGQELGTAAFGDRSGTLYELDGGGLGLVVDRGEPISWLAIGGNLDQATFRALAAALHKVD